jgi:hypothetical protein
MVFSGPGVLLARQLIIGKSSDGPALREGQNQIVEIEFMLSTPRQGITTRERGGI